VLHPQKEKEKEGKKSHTTTHVSESNPSRASSSALASSSFALSFSLASTGNQSCIKFISAQSTFATRQGACVREREQEKQEQNSHEFTPPKKKHTTHIDSQLPPTVLYTSDIPPAPSSASSQDTAHKTNVHNPIESA